MGVGEEDNVDERLQPHRIDENIENSIFDVDLNTVSALPLKILEKSITVMLRWGKLMDITILKVESLKTLEMIKIYHLIIVLEFIFLGFSFLC